MDNKYIKVTYQSKPIGEEKIILYLTTFDYEGYKRDQELKTQTFSFPIKSFKFNESEYLNSLSEMLNNYVKEYYEPKIKELKTLIKINKTTMSLMDAENIINSGNVKCNIVRGNITNCNNVYCTEIKGRVINCNKIFYK